MNEQVLLFYSGYLSQWYGSYFTVEGVDYNCAEQYMMAQKAKEFGDIDAYQAIMMASHPREQKRLGRLVKNFDQRRWNLLAKAIVYEGNLAKFSQNKHIKAKLLATGDRIIAEASPYDKIWGIGLALNNKDALDPQNWNGSNWLGEVLMAVRENLRNSEK